MKPALEPIIVAQVPYIGKPRDCIVATGAGALWVDGGRVPTGGGTARPPLSTNKHAGWQRPWNENEEARLACEARREDAHDKRDSAGRWPPNFVLSHLETCNGVCAPDCPVRRLGEQSGERDGRNPMGTKINGVSLGSDTTRDIYGKKLYEIEGKPGYADTGTAARFFPNPDWQLDIAERIAAADPVLYAAKASRRERSAGLPDGVRNSHPTVKSIMLARWLATLLLPPDAYAPRRLLVPFSGSGSEMIGAMLAGWEDVQGIEGEAEYVEIARARLAWWDANRDKAPEVRAMGQSPRAAERASDPTGATRHDRMHGGNYANGANRTNAPAPTPMLPGLEAAP